MPNINPATLSAFDREVLYGARRPKMEKWVDRYGGYAEAANIWGWPPEILRLFMISHLTAPLPEEFFHNIAKQEGISMNAFNRTHESHSLFNELHGDSIPGSSGPGEPSVSVQIQDANPSAAANEEVRYRRTLEAATATPVSLGLSVAKAQDPAQETKPQRELSDFQSKSIDEQVQLFLAWCAANPEHAQTLRHAETALSAKRTHLVRLRNWLNHELKNELREHCHSISAMGECARLLTNKEIAELIKEVQRTRKPITSKHPLLESKRAKVGASEEGSSSPALPADSSAAAPAPAALAASVDSPTATSMGLAFQAVGVPARIKILTRFLKNPLTHKLAQEQIEKELEQMIASSSNEQQLMQLTSLLSA